MLPRFYCEACDKFIDRRKVYAEYDELAEPTYYCKGCGCSVFKTVKVLKSIIRDSIKWDRQHNRNIDGFK